MFFFRSLIKARKRMQAGNTAGEMSFLEHLEELRRTLVRMCMVLIVAMVACFAFTPSMMSVLRYPVEQVWAAHEQDHLPSRVEAEDWIAAKELAREQRTLPPKAAELLEGHFSETVRALAQAVPALRAARLLPAKDQRAFLEQALADAGVRERALALHEAGADLDEGRGHTEAQMMGAFQPGEAFMLSLQLAFFGGLIVAGPVLLYLLLRFIVPGLRENERRIIFRSLWWGLGLFLGGCAFSYFAVLPRVLAFFFEYSWRMGIENDWRIGYYITFAAKLIFVFGLIFELPVIMVPLIKLGVLTHARMRRMRPYALVGSFAAALVLAPAPDPGTMLLMALPLYLLYELCMLIAWRDDKRRAASMQDYAP